MARGAISVVHAADTLAFRGIILHALLDEAKLFHGALGFNPILRPPRESPIQSDRNML